MSALPQQRQSNRLRLRQNFGSWGAASRRKRPTALEHHECFNKDVILLPSPAWVYVCKQTSKHFLHENGHILSAFEFRKSWDHLTVLQQIRDAFGSRIPEDVSLQILMGCGNKLVTPNLREGQLFDGHMIRKVFRSKALYVRPSGTILDYNNDTEDTSSVLQGPNTRGKSKVNQPKMQDLEDYQYDSDSCFEVDATASSFPQPPNSLLPIDAVPCSKSSPNSRIRSPSRCGTASSMVAATNSLPPSVYPAPISHTVGLGSASCNVAATNSLPPSSSAPATSHYVTTGGGTSSSVAVSTCPVRYGTDEPNSSDYATYLSLMTDFSDLSSDDEELNLAIMASIETQQAQASQCQEVSVTEILLELAKKITPHIRCKFNINRSAVLDGAFRGFKRTTYNPNATMNVKFSDDLGRNEESVDLGGPRREFLRLLMEALVMSPMFEGSGESQNLALDMAALGDDRYFLAGKAIAVSIVHGGPPPAFFSTTLFDCLVGGPHTAKPVLEDVADTDIYQWVKKVSQSSTHEDLVRATLPLQDYLANAGCLRPLKTIDDRFLEGLKTLGVLEKIKNHPESFRPLFCYQPHPLTAEAMDDLFNIRLSPQGSNKRIAEEVVVPFWRDYLQDAQDEGPAKLKGILAFATGATAIPPIGFNPTPSIDFLHENGHQDTSSLPIANTCINCLNLPLHTSYAVFKDKMDFALGNTHGFGRA
ncbi:unnamed protein product [Gadus morhua 'NCC']